MAIKYVDFTNGNDADDGTDPVPQGGGIGPWATTGKAATTIAVGDTARVRGGMTETIGADIQPTNDGTANSYITIEGIYTAAGSDDWGDGNTTRPVLDFNGAAFQFLINGDQFWKLKSLDFLNSHDTNGALRISFSRAAIIEDCRIYDSNAHGIKTLAAGGLLIKDCVFDNNTGASLFIESDTRIEGCSFNGDGDNAIGISVASTDRGVYLVSPACVQMKNSTFGNDTNGDHDTADIEISVGGVVIGRNCKLDSASEVTVLAPSSLVIIEDDEQSFGAGRAWSFPGIVTKDDGETPPGGSGWAFKCEPDADCGTIQVLFCGGQWFEGFPVYLDGTEQTITVKIKCLDADWSLGGGTGGRPDNTELFIELEYSDGATTKATATSTEACSDDTYTSFTVTVTPNAAGKATVTAILNLFEAGAAVFVDPVVTIS